MRKKSAKEQAQLANDKASQEQARHLESIEKRRVAMARGTLVLDENAMMLMSALHGKNIHVLTPPAGMADGQIKILADKLLRLTEPDKGDGANDEVISALTTKFYSHESHVVIRQFSRFPDGVQIRVPANNPLPLLPGLPRQFLSEVISQRWVRNEQPKGVDT